MSRKLVASFSASGTTAKVAETLAEAIGADIYEIEPAAPYSKADLDWTNQKSRSSIEMSDPASRPVIAGKRDNMDDYDTVFVGFPIWWYVAPHIINTFLESYDLTGKTIIPFATSGGSGMGETNEKLQPSCPNSKLIEGKVFKAHTSKVEIIDIAPGDHYIGDISRKETLEAFASYVLDKHGHVDYLINNALPLMKGISECSYEEFQYALSVGVTAPFYLSKLFSEHFGKGGVIINISSSRDRMSQPQTESYTAAKGGIAALTHALAVSFSGKLRVNSISPGWIDTDYREYEGADAVQQPSGRVGNPMDIANMVLFLCSEKAGFITGENICIDGGMTKQMIYHGDHGWKLEI